MGSRRAGEFRGTDRFVVRRRVGSGGMGVVYEAYDLERDMRVAIKTILDAEASTLYRFKKEFRALTDVSHPNLVKIHELVLSDEQCFYTMEFVDGVDFLRYVCPAQTPSPDNPLSDTMETYVALEFDPPHRRGRPHRRGDRPGESSGGGGRPSALGHGRRARVERHEDRAGRAWASGPGLAVVDRGRAPPADVRRVPAGQRGGRRSGPRRRRGLGRQPRRSTRSGSAPPCGSSPRRSRPARRWAAASRHQAVQRAGHAAGSGRPARLRPRDRAGAGATTTSRRPTGISSARSPTWPPSRRRATRSRRRATGTASA